MMVVHLASEHFRRSPVPKDSLDHFYRSPWWVSLGGTDIVWLVVVGSWEIWTENEVVLFKDFVVFVYPLKNEHITTGWKPEDHFQTYLGGGFRSMFQRFFEFLPLKMEGYDPIRPTVFCFKLDSKKTLKWKKASKRWVVFQVNSPRMLCVPVFSLPCVWSKSCAQLHFWKVT